MASTQIKTIDCLKDYLHRAMQLEHATIPPYLTALYSIRAGTNMDAMHILRAAVVEEMLHLTLVANLLNAIGGQPDLTDPAFVPSYPALLPDGEKDFKVSLERFSQSAIKTFLNIERPRRPPDETQRIISKGRPSTVLASTLEKNDEEFYSIGEFYEEIRRGFAHLYKTHGSELFCGDPARQIGPEYYYSGGGEIHVVKDIDTANAAIELIVGQGEGIGGGIYDKHKELSHYYRFEQLLMGQYYMPKDKPHEPTGPRFQVDWDAVLPIKSNSRVNDYDSAPELKQAAVDFNKDYAWFLGLLTAAYDGSPDMLKEAVPEMFRLRDGMVLLMRNPIPGAQSLNAAPTFELAAVTPSEGGVS